MRATSSNLLAPTTSLSPSCPIRVWRFFPFHSASSSTRKFHRTDLLGKIVRNFLQFRMYHFQVDRSRRISSLAWFHPDEKVEEFATSILRFVRLFSTSIRDKRKEQKEKNLIYIPVRIAPFVHPGEKPLETRIFAKTRFFHDSAANRVANVELALTRRFAPDKATLFAEFTNRERSCSGFTTRA